MTIIELFRLICEGEKRAGTKLPATPPITLTYHHNIVAAPKAPTVLRLLLEYNPRQNWLCTISAVGLASRTALGCKRVRPKGFFRATAHRPSQSY